MGLGKYWPNLNISEAIVMGLEVSFLGDFVPQRLNFSLELQSHKVSNLPFPYLHFCTSMWPCNILYVSHWILTFLLCFSTELDVEDFDAFLEKVKARSLGNSPFACKFRPALRNL